MSVQIRAIYREIKYNFFSTPYIKLNYQTFITWNYADQSEKESKIYIDCQQVLNRTGEIILFEVQ